MMVLENWSKFFSFLSIKKKSSDELLFLVYTSAVDIISIASGSTDGRKCRNKLKQRLKQKKYEVVTICHQLKMQAPDGKMKETDVADIETRGFLILDDGVEELE